MGKPGLTPPPVFDPVKPHFYIVKLEFTADTLFFLFLLKNIDCGYSLEPPRRGGSNEWISTIYVLSRNMKISEFLSENFQFLVVKFSVYLNRFIFIKVLSLFDPYLSFFWCLGRLYAVVVAFPGYLHLCFLCACVCVCVSVCKCV